MGIFHILSGKDGREKHAVLDVIEFSSPNSVLVCKHACENFNTGSQLIVAESQAAVFFKDGVALESFPAGSYTLTTQNYPFIRALVRNTTGGKSPFQCAVYFVNKAVSMGISWGTDAPIRMNDPLYNLPTDITAYGDFSVQVEDEKRLLCELVGTTPSYTQEEISRYFSGLIAAKVRSLIAGVILEQKLSLLGIDAHLSTISDLLREKVQDVFAAYGIRIRHFVVANISYKGLEKVESMLHQQTVKNIEFTGQLQRNYSQRDFSIDTQVKEGRATAEINRELGISQLQKQMIGVAKVQAANPGPIMSGNSLGIGLPGMPIGKSAGSPMQSAGAATTDSLRVIAELSKDNPPQPAEATPQPITVPGDMPGRMPDRMAAAERPKQADSFEERVKKLAIMRENNLLTEEEFAEQKQALLGQIMKGGGGNA